MRREYVCTYISRKGSFYQSNVTSLVLMTPAFCYSRLRVEKVRYAVVIAATTARAPPTPHTAAAPSPGADWKRVDVGKLGDIDLDAHMLMLRQEKARRARGCERRRVYRVWVEKACKFNDLIVHKFRREKN